MTFNLIFFVIFFFVCITVMHILIWRFLKPKNQVAWLFTVYLIFPLLMLPFFIYKTDSKDFLDFLFAGFFYFILAQFYIQTYTAVQAVAPSLQIIYLLYKTGKAGLTEEEIEKHFDYKNLVQDRIDDLKSDNFICEKDNFLYLNTSGKILANIFYYYRKLYGLEIGEG